MAVQINSTIRKRRISEAFAVAAMIVLAIDISDTFIGYCLNYVVFLDCPRKSVNKSYVGNTEISKCKDMLPRISY